MTIKEFEEHKAKRQQRDAWIAALPVLARLPLSITIIVIVIASLG
jgi:hypothetical protein